MRKLWPVLLGLTVSLGTNALVWTMDDVGQGRLYVLETNDGDTPATRDLRNATLFRNGRAMTDAATRSLLGYEGGAAEVPIGGHATWGIKLSLLVDRPGLYRFKLRSRDGDSNEARVLILPAR